MKNKTVNIKENNFFKNLFSFSLYRKEVKENFIQNKKSIIFFLALALIIILLDQITKQIALNVLIQIPSNQIEVLGFFNFSLVINNGVSFGMFSTIPFAKEVLSFVVLNITLFLICLFLREKNFEIALSYVLIISGAIGNTIDRVTIGGVIDFLDFYIGSYHYPAFNIADTIIFIGATILIFPNFTKKILRIKTV